MTTNRHTIELPAEAEAIGWHRTRKGDKLRYVHPETGWTGLVLADALGGAAWQAHGPKGRKLRPVWIQEPSVAQACRAATAALAEVPALTAQLTHGAGSPGPREDPQPGGFQHRDGGPRA